MCVFERRAEGIQADSHSQCHSDTTWQVNRADIRYSRLRTLHYTNITVCESLHYTKDYTTYNQREIYTHRQVRQYITHAWSYCVSVTTGSFTDLPHTLRPDDDPSYPFVHLPSPHGAPGRPTCLPGMDPGGILLPPVGLHR